ncbi:MAG: tyrosine-type recombinase/integrase [Anaerolineae bacterium]|jgi:site-specific recombinase XerD|nr:tyrosine-type recombinase/integrase [Anaerolineae bacterium]MBT7192123.1 tyrosine-type recombinase/integrase [Anaerolineae bacterium]
MNTWQAEWKTYLKEKYQHKSDKSIKAAEQHLRVFCEWWQADNFSTFEPARLTSFDLIEYRHHSDEEKIAANTWNARVSALRTFCDFLELPQLKESLRMREVGYKASKNRSLTRPERLAIMRELEINLRGAKTTFKIKSALRELTAVGLMLTTGMRVSEIAALQIDDLKRIGDRTWILTIRHGKGNKERDAHLGKSARKLLGDWLEFRLASAMDTSSLFDISERTLLRHVKDAGYNAGIEGVTPHWLRYTFAKRLEKEFKATIEEIRDLLGHASIETTRRYLASGFEEKQSLVEGM